MLAKRKGISVNTYQNCYGDRVVCHGEYDAESIRTKCKTRQHTNVPKPSLLMTINDVNFSRAVSFSDMQCRSQTMVSNFFDARSVPREDWPAIQELVRQFETVVVENHPAFCGAPVFEFQQGLVGQLEVAVGLETIHPEILPWLNKQMTPTGCPSPTESKSS